MLNLKNMFSTLSQDLHHEVDPNEPEFSRTERNVRINVYHGIVDSISLNLASPFIGIFAIKIGASNFQVGLLSSGPALVSLLSMIPGARYLDKRSNQKEILSKLILFHRLFYLLISFIPFFTEDKRASMLVILVALMNMPGSVFNVGWQAYISKVIPVSRRADAFALRNKLINLSGTITVLLTGMLIDAIGFPVGYQVVFAAAFAMAVVEVYLFNRLEENVVKDTDAIDNRDRNNSGESEGLLQSLANEVREISKHTEFLRFMLASLIFHFAWQIPWPLFTLYQVKELGATNTWISILSLSNTVGSIVGYSFWPKVLTKHGNLKTLFASGIWIFVVPTVYAFSKSLATIGVFNFLTGAIFAGVNLSLFNTLLDVTPTENKATYIAYYTTVINASAIFAPMVGVGLGDKFGFFWAFIICAGLRVAGSLTFLLLNYLDKQSG
ncbi:MAG: MFS transporter [Firmicutes bacterium]|nr:MFS transporter [Candidatus Fermentithermobacillaceae bacterium]